MSRHVFSIVGVGAGFATCPNDAEFGGRARQVQGGVKIQQLVSEWASVGGVGRSRGTNSHDFEELCPI